MVYLRLRFRAGTELNWGLWCRVSIYTHSQRWMSWENKPANWARQLPNSSRWDLDSRLPDLDTTVDCFDCELWDDHLFDFLYFVRINASSICCISVKIMIWYLWIAILRDAIWCHSLKQQQTGIYFRSMFSFFLSSTFFFWLFQEKIRILIVSRFFLSW